MTDGLLEHGGALLVLTAPGLAALEELLRRLVLAALVQAQRLSESFRDRLLSWGHSGFSVHGAQVVLPEETGRLAHLARYATRPPLARHRIRKGPGSRCLLTTCPTPRRTATSTR